MLFLSLVSLFAFFGNVQASDTGALSPGTIADDATVGTVAWTNPDNAKVSDNVYATVSLIGIGISHYLKATNFGFSIPTGATINGILVEIEKKDISAAVSGGHDEYVKIVKGTPAYLQISSDS